MRRYGGSLVLAGLALFGVGACCAGSRDRKATPADTAKAEAACRAKPRYSPPMSASMKADLDRKCAGDPGLCKRFRESIAGVCVYQDRVAKIPLSERVEVYATLGSSSLAFTDLCRAIRSLPGVGFLQDVDVWIARGGEPFWGKSWRLRCAQGTGSGGEHR
jgi:hypothetical protein